MHQGGGLTNLHHRKTPVYKDVSEDLGGGWRKNNDAGKNDES
jgi:hypothetical protein